MDETIVIFLAVHLMANAFFSGRLYEHNWPNDRCWQDKAVTVTGAFVFLFVGVEVTVIRLLSRLPSFLRQMHKRLEIEALLFILRGQHRSMSDKHRKSLLMKRNFLQIKEKKDLRTKYRLFLLKHILKH